jgi:flagellin-like protein
VIKIKLPTLLVQEKNDLKINKKGISPLIATVLLIAFVILIAVLVWFWWDKIIHEQTQKIGAQTTGEISCAQDISFAASNPYCNSGTKSAGVTIENTNTGNIYKFLVRAKESDEVKEVIESPLSLQASAAGELGISYNSTLYSGAGPNSLEIIPQILSQGATITCNEKAEIVSLSC